MARTDVNKYIPTWRKHNQPHNPEATTVKMITSKMKQQAADSISTMPEGMAQSLAGCREEISSQHL
jgi:hypothetical protein